MKVAEEMASLREMPNPQRIKAHQPRAFPWRQAARALPIALVYKNLRPVFVITGAQCPRHTVPVRDAEAEKMRNQKEAYSQQSILLSDLLKQTSSLIDAESQWNQAVLAYWSARADFQKALGKE